ncbi:MAG: hypothetical protein ACI8SK_001492 [Shewanella sp.]
MAVGTVFLLFKGLNVNEKLIYEAWSLVAKLGFISVLTKPE